jgi:hypothetical protein
MDLQKRFSRMKIHILQSFKKVFSFFLGIIYNNYISIQYYYLTHPHTSFEYNSRQNYTA